MCKTHPTPYVMVFFCVQCLRSEVVVHFVDIEGIDYLHISDFDSKIICLQETFSFTAAKGSSLSIQSSMKITYNFPHNMFKISMW